MQHGSREICGDHSPFQGPSIARLHDESTLVFLTCTMQSCHCVQLLEMWYMLKSTHLSNIEWSNTVVTITTTVKLRYLSFSAIWHQPISQFRSLPNLADTWLICVFYLIFFLAYQPSVCFDDDRMSFIIRASYWLDGNYSWQDRNEFVFRLSLYFVRYTFQWEKTLHLFLLGLCFLA